VIENVKDDKANDWRSWRYDAELVMYGRSRKTKTARKIRNSVRAQLWYSYAILRGYRKAASPDENGEKFVNNCYTNWILRRAFPGLELRKEARGGNCQNLKGRLMLQSYVICIIFGEGAIRWSLRYCIRRSSSCWKTRGIQ